MVRHLALAPFLGGGRAGCDVRLVDEAFSFAEALETMEDEPLLAALRGLLQVVGRSVERVCLATFSGACSRELVRVVKSSDDDGAVTKPGAPPEWSRSSVLLLNAEDTLVRIARRRAHGDVAIAAHVLCRAVLLSQGPIVAKDVDRLLEAR